MNGTPRLRSAYPATPDTSQVKRRSPPNNLTSPGSPLPDIPENKSTREDADAVSPLIPFETIDAPTQRFYVFAFWIGLLAWRLYDWYLLLLDDNESLWLFMKWVAIDATFLYGVPALRIPWLEWSTLICTILFVGHAVCNLMLMFRIMPPFQAPLIYMAKMLWDKELAISERRVKANDILHNSSLILGRQTIHILPEGSAMLNPYRTPFCLDSGKDKIQVPIMINQTEPISLELTRTDLETGQTETIPLAKKALDKLRKQAINTRTSEGGLPNEPLYLQYEFQKTGIYKIQKIVDKSELEVRAKPSEVTVVTCPSARISTRNTDRCKGDLSDLTLDVSGTPPLKVQYKKVINDLAHQVLLQSIKPDDYGFNSELSAKSEAVVPADLPMEVILAQKRTVPVSLNESLGNGGRWLYYVAEVEDRLGNLVMYPDPDAPKAKNKMASFSQELAVHERPLLWFQNCNPQRPLRVAMGQNALLDLHYDSTSGGPITSNSYDLEYTFTPAEESDESATQLKRLSTKHTQRGIDVKHPGLYQLRSVSTDFCQGEVYEPSSCIVHNPPEPSLSLDADQEFDKCAGRTIGLRAKLEFVGTPPFNVQFKTERDGAPAVVQNKKFTGMSGEVMLGTTFAGKHRYIFTEISDSVYKSRTLKGLQLEQEIKAVARAELLDTTRRHRCLGTEIPFHVALYGEGPWKLEYQLLHGGKKVKHDSIDVSTDHYTINTGPFEDGGDYTLSLLSITDAMGCKETLNHDASVSVQMNKPKVAFASIDGKQRAEVLEGAKQSIPLRLTGEGPWAVEYRNLDKSPDRVLQKNIRHGNDEITVTDAGIYELVGVRDSLCPGVVEPAANQFVAAWIPRPSIGISESSVVKPAGRKFVKHEVCEGDEDYVELKLDGASPFDISYQVEQIGARRYNKQLTVPQKMATIRMDTDKSGVVRYHFPQPGDRHYKQPKTKDAVLMLEQTVNPRPTAKFTETAKTYSFCSTEPDGEQIIPITLTGQPPFHVEVEVKHQSSNKPETRSFPNIPSTKYDLRIPHHLLSYGTSSVHIRRIRDARGCDRSIEDSKERVLVSVNHAPTITPLEKQTHYCVGDRLSFSLAGSAPFEVFYSFNGVAQRAHSYGTTFRRIAEKPGTFIITAVKDKASNECRAQTEVTKIIHEMPSVRISKGKDSVVDIHEGGAAELLFEFGGTPPFEFTYTRSTTERKGKRGKILETRKEISYEHSMRVRASEEGTYEVVSIKDAHCSFSRQPGDSEGKGQKLLQY